MCMVNFCINMEDTGLQNKFTKEEIENAKEVVRNFYDNKHNNISKFNKAIEVFNYFYPDGTFEQLKTWSKKGK